VRDQCARLGLLDSRARGGFVLPPRSFLRFRILLARRQVSRLHFVEVVRSQRLSIVKLLHAPVFVLGAVEADACALQFLCPRAVLRL